MIERFSCEWDLMVTPGRRGDSTTPDDPPEVSVSAIGLAGKNTAEEACSLADLLSRKGMCELLTMWLNEEEQIASFRQFLDDTLGDEVLKTIDASDIDQELTP